MAVALVVAAGGVQPTAAGATTPSPAWQVRSVPLPFAFSSSDALHVGGVSDKYQILLTNVGGASSDGTTITITDTLPPGVTTDVEPKHFPEGPGDQAENEGPHNWSCTPAGAGHSSFSCTTTLTVGALEQAPVVTVPLRVDPAVPDSVLTNSVTASGGGAANATASQPTILNPSSQPPFQVQDLVSYVATSTGTLDTQAADHPNALITDVDLTSLLNEGPGRAFKNNTVPAEDPNNLVLDLPAGLVGNPQGLPHCPLSSLVAGSHGSSCPTASQIGSVAFDQEGYFAQDYFGVFTHGKPIAVFNITPEGGHAAEFGFLFANEPVVMYAAVVGNGLQAHVRVTVPGIPAAGQLGFQGATVTFYGNPATQDSSLTSPIAFFTNPGDCSGQPRTTTVHADSYEHPGRHNPDGTPDFSDPSWKTATTTIPPVTGCNTLHFNPTISLQPDTAQAGSPAGLAVDLNLPQNADPNGLATPDLKDTTVTLPVGMTVSPSAANGLLGCSDAQIDLATNVPASCPDGSKIGTAVVHTPLLDHVLPGTVYLGTPLCAPCTNADAQSGRMLRLFIEVNDPASGVVLKLPGTVSADPGTGQLKAMFKDNPQLPFDDLKLQFKGGPRGTLATPRACGTYTSITDLSPWSAPFTPDATPTSSFQVTGCGNPNTFAPTFDAGTTNPQAGAYSPFSLSFSRDDPDQELSRLSVALPPGLLAKLAGVPQCADADANAGTCPASSQVGTVTAGAGPGSHPFFVPGHVYLTGPYNGAPYGLAVQVPAIAGPFNLGTVVVRQALHVDTADAHVTAVSDPFPTILDGIPLQIRTVKVAIDRPSFTLNPTSCEPMRIAGTLTSTGGLTAPVSSRFQAANCARLPFHPVFAAATQAKTSKASGASLTVNVSQNPGEANIHQVNLQLPLSLPARLTTLQKACAEAQFAANPAGCPAASNIGTATAVTPLLEAPLAGPAILVSHGGAAFPDVEFVLQGQGIEIILDGKTDIKKGVTYSRFETVPDAPISSFATNLPEGPHSALAAYGNLCHLTTTVTRRTRVAQRVHGHLVHTLRTVTHTVNQPLTMPTTIIAQNGAVITQTTKIAVTGCPRAHKAKKRRPAVARTNRQRKKR